MTDAAQLMSTYREGARGLWNNALRPGADFDSVDAFAEICGRLFDELVLRPLGMRGYRKPRADDPYPFLRLVPRGDPVPIMINRPSEDGNRYWDDPIRRLGCKGLTLLFVDYFDWDQRGYIDLQYYRVKIAASDEQPQIVGREALVEVHHAQAVFEP